MSNAAVGCEIGPVVGLDAGEDIEPFAKDLDKLFVVHLLYGSPLCDQKQCLHWYHPKTPHKRLAIGLIILF